jgi:hypothetical protein
MNPGCTMQTTTREPRLRSSTRSEPRNPRTACLAATSGEYSGIGTLLATETTATIEPPEGSSSGSPARGVHHAAERDVVGAIEVLRGQLVEGAVRERGRARDQHVDAAEPVRRLGDRALERSTIRHVDREHRRGRARRRHRARRRVEAVAAAGDQRQTRALLCEEPRRGEADAA